MFETWFIKNKKLLEENSRAENLIDLSFEIDRFSIKIDHIEFSSIVWFIGKFWSWKSNFLNQIKAKYTENAKWFDFDAWKYPERSNLWENFILEFARQIDKETFDKTMKQVDWTIDDDKKTLINTIWDIPWLSVIKNFNHFIKTTPAKRNFEVENLLNELIKKVEEDNIYIIIEDIDRSWDNWIFFLETLNHFLKTNKIEKRIIVIVPIWEENYKKEEVKLSYLKSLDYIHEYSLREVKLDNFVKELFLDEIYKVNYLKWQIVTFLEWIFKEFTDQITMRTLKHILRNANSNYIALLKKQWEWVNWRLSIVFETAKYIKHNSWDFYIDIWRKSKKVWWSESIFSALINCVFQDNHRVNWQKYTDIYEDDYSWNQKVIKTRNFSYSVPIKFVSYKYSSWKVKDWVLYFTDDFDGKNNYAWIIEDYLI